MSERCFYFGCWNEPGHFLFAPSVGKFARSAYGVVGREVGRIEMYGDHVHLDATLAPRRDRDGNLCWRGQGVTQQERERISSRSEECEQGAYLCHELDNGFTAMQWWDRNQGDTRGACNSTILLEGKHTAEEVLEAGRRAFPHVFARLEKAGVVLRPVIQENI